MECINCIWDQKNISKCEVCIHNDTRRKEIPGVNNYNNGQEYYIDEEVKFMKDGKITNGKIKNFLTRQETKECNMWCTPLVLELEDKSLIEIAEHELIVDGEQI